MLKLASKDDCYYRFHAKENGKAIGQFGFVDQGSANELKIVAFSIYGEYRNKGYGQQMMREAIAEANKIRGKRMLTLDVLKGNSKALHIYKKHGFEIAGDFGPEAFHMVYRLYEQPCLKVSDIQRTDLRQFYDSTWVVKFDSGAWCKLIRYDTDTAEDVIHDVEKCRCVIEVETSCDFRNKILYD